MAQIWAEPTGRSRPSRGQTHPNTRQHRLPLAKFGATSAINRSTVAQSVQIRPDPFQIRPCSAQYFETSSGNFDQHWPLNGQSRPEFDELGPDRCQCRPTAVRIRQRLARMRPSLTRVRCPFSPPERGPCDVLGCIPTSAQLGTSPKSGPVEFDPAGATPTRMSGSIG